MSTALLCRLDFATGSSTTGASNTGDVFNMFLSCCVEIGAYPDWKILPLYLNPVDLVVQSIIQLAFECKEGLLDQTTGRLEKQQGMFHVFHQNEIHMETLPPLFLEYFGVEVLRLDESSWLERLDEIPSSSDAFRIKTSWMDLKTTLVGQTISNEINISSARTTQILKLLGINLLQDVEAQLVQMFRFCAAEQNVKLHRPTGIWDEMKRDCAMEFKHCCAIRENSNPTQQRSVFLTGSTGFVGVFLMQELLSKTNMTIFCLVRAANEQEVLKNFVFIRSPT